MVASVLGIFQLCLQRYSVTCHRPDILWPLAFEAIADQTFGQSLLEIFQRILARNNLSAVAQRLSRARAARRDKTKITGVFLVLWIPTIANLGCKLGTDSEVNFGMFLKSTLGIEMIGSPLHLVVEPRFVRSFEYDTNYRLPNRFMQLRLSARKSWRDYSSDCAVRGTMPIACAVSLMAAPRQGRAQALRATPRYPAPRQAKRNSPGWESKGVPPGTPAGFRDLAASAKAKIFAATSWFRALSGISPT